MVLTVVRQKREKTKTDIIIIIIIIIIPIIITIIIIIIIYHPLFTVKIFLTQIKKKENLPSSAGLSLVGSMFTARNFFFILRFIPLVFGLGGETSSVGSAVTEVCMVS